MSWTPLISTVVVNVVVLLGGWLTYKQIRKASVESNAVARDTLEVQKRKELVDDLSRQLDRLWPRLEQMDATIDEQRVQIDTVRNRLQHLERENADLRQHTVECAADVEELRSRINDYADRYRVAVVYVRALHNWMAEHLPGELRPPDPPEGLAFDLADPMQNTTAPPPPGWPPARVARRSAADGDDA